MSNTKEKIAKIDFILKENNAPLLNYLDKGLNREEIIDAFIINDIYQNESLISLFEWHNGVLPINGGIMFSKIELLPNSTFYNLKWLLNRKKELLDWKIIDEPELYIPFFGTLESNMYLLKNDLSGGVYDLCPGANVYGELQFTSIDQMLDFVIECYENKIFEIDSLNGLMVNYDEYYAKLKYYRSRAT